MSSQTELEPLKDQIQNELELATQSRAAGNEGRARVCARRAAGWAGAYYLFQQHEIVKNRNAYDSLKRIQDAKELPIEVRKAAGRLTTQITEDHLLPFPEDPLDDARLIVNQLLS